MYEAIDGRKFADSKEASAYNAELERLQGFADRMIGTIDVDRLKLLCRGKAASFVGSGNSSQII